MGVFRDKIKKISFVTKVYRNISGADKREIMEMCIRDSRKNEQQKEKNRKRIVKCLKYQ